MTTLVAAFGAQVPGGPLLAFFSSLFDFVAGE
jgi:hypothetical protein